MKTLRSFATLMSAFAVAAVFAPGIAFGEDTDATEPKSDIGAHIYAFGDSLRVERRSVKVPYADLNLAEEKGAAVLYRRLQVASESVCGIRLARDQRSLRWTKIAEDCYERALSAAVDSVGSEVLLSLHKGTKPPEMYAAAPK